MPVKQPGQELLHSIPLKTVQKHVAGGGKKSLYAALNLVAYIDMMTVLVIFLLMTFSASGEILFVSKNIVLPGAQNWRDLDRAPVIGVAADVVTLDGRQVARAEELKEDTAVDWKIPDLYDQLVQLKKNWTLLHPNEQFQGNVIVQSDGKVEFKVIKKVMFSCAVAGYGNVNFAVQPKSKGGGAAPAAAAH